MMILPGPEPVLDFRCQRVVRDSKKCLSIKKKKNLRPCLCVDVVKSIQIHTLSNSLAIRKVHNPSSPLNSSVLLPVQEFFHKYRWPEISFMATIIRVASPRAKIFITPFNLATAIRSNGHKLRFIAIDISALQLVLSSLSNGVREKHSRSSRGRTNR